jgi:hypothetical protein
MAVLATGGHLGEIQHIPQYKGDNTREVRAHFSMLRDAIVRYSFPVLGHLECPPEDDDDLDALVGFLNVVELLTNRGDWLGSTDHGYFLITKILAFSIGELWEAVVGH